MSTRRYLFLTGLLLLVLVFATHGRSVWAGHGFVNYDDHDVVFNPRFEEPPLEAVGGILTGTTFFTWLPLYFLSLGLDRVLFGTDPVGFHLVNVLLHALNSLLVAAIVLRLSRKRWTAFAAGAIFAVLPGLTESVAWVASRKDLVSFLFLGLSLLLALRSVREDGGVRRGSYVASLVLLALAMMAKGTALVLPLMLLAHAWIRRGRPGEALRPIQIVPHLVVAGALAAVHFLVALDQGVASPAESGIGALLVADLGVLGRYLAALVLLPVQTVAHRVVPGTLDAWTGVGILALGGFAAAVLARRRAPLLALGALWFLLALAPFNNVLPRTSLLLAERYLYVPALGAAVALAWALGRTGRTAGTFALVAVVAALGTETFVRTGVWKDSETLWNDAAAKDPGAYLPVQKLGEHHAHESKRFTEARYAFERAVGLATTAGDEVRARADLATMLHQLHRPVEALEEIDRASRRMEDLSGRDARMLGFQLAITRGKACEDLQRVDEALLAYREASRLAPDDPRGPYNAGTLLVRHQRGEDAAAALEEAVRRADRPGGRAHLALALLNLVTVDLNRGDLDGAEERLRRAEEAGADVGSVALRRARLLRQRGRSDEAYALLEAATRERPNDPSIPWAIAQLRREDARSALGSGDAPAALRCAREAVRWTPGDPEARLLLARVLRLSGKLEAALVEAEAARETGEETAAVNRERAEILLLLAGQALAGGDREAAAVRAREALDGDVARLEAGGAPLDRRLLDLLRAGSEDERWRTDLLASLAEAATGGVAPSTLERLATIGADGSGAAATAALTLRGTVRARAGDLDGAIEDLRTATARDPASADARLLLAEALEARGDLDEARTEYETVARAAPERLEARVGAALTLGAQGRTVDALARLNEMLSEHPDRAAIHRAFADLFLRRHAASPDPKLLSSAEDHLMRAIEADPADARTLTRLARVWAASGRAGEAIALLRQALERRPDLDEARAALSGLYLRAGRGYLDKGRLDPAEDLARRAVALRSESVDALLLRGDVRRARKLWAGARADYERALSLDPESDPVVDALASWWKDEGYRRLLRDRDDEGAVEAFDEAIGLAPRNVDLRSVHAMLRSIADRQRKQRSVDIVLRAGHAQLLEGKLDVAERSARAAMRMDETSAAAHDLLGRVLDAAGRRAEAEDAWRAALKIDADHSDSRLQLANLLFRSGRDADAEEAYREWLIRVDAKTPGAADQIRDVRAILGQLRKRLGKDGEGD